MALPKHFNQTKNTQNRIKSLNDLIFCTVKYDFTLTGEEIEDFNTQEEITGVKDFSALNEEQAKAKIEKPVKNAGPKGDSKSKGKSVGTIRKMA